jgi:hypothetical protein
VYCQFIVERVQHAVRVSNVLPSIIVGPRANRNSHRSTYHADKAWSSRPGPDAPDNDVGSSALRQTRRLTQPACAGPGTFVSKFVNFAKSKFSKLTKKRFSMLQVAEDGDEGAEGAAAPAGAVGKAPGLPSAPFPGEVVYASNPADDVPFEGAAATDLALFARLNHVIDLALDDVCESSMPNQFYQYCAPILRKQGKVSNLLARHFKPQDICVDIQMCSKRSYIFRILKHAQKPARSVHGLKNLAKRVFSSLKSSAKRTMHSVKRTVHSVKTFSR